MTAATASLRTSAASSQAAPTMGRGAAPPDDALSGARKLAEGGIALGGALVYGVIAFGVLAGLGVSTYLWRQRSRAGNLLNTSPLERAEQLIASCETKLASIEEAVADLRGAR